MVTEYAEGELFQILEDDGSLPEGQVHQTGSETVTVNQKQKRRLLTCSVFVYIP